MSRLSTKGIEFKWNYSSSVLMGRKGFTPALNKQCATVFQQHMYKFMPFDTGLMANSVRISGNSTTGTITYTTKYAKWLYEGVDPRTGVPYNIKQEKHSLATSHWDKACWTAEGRDIINELNAYRRAHSV